MDMVILIFKNIFWIIIIGKKLLMTMYFLLSERKEPESPQYIR